MSVEADMTFGETSSASSRLQYTSKVITSQAFEVFDELRQRNQLCDVTINVDGHEYSAHRVVLAAVSPYFRGMFTGEFNYLWLSGVFVCVCVCVCVCVSLVPRPFPPRKGPGTH